MIKKTRQRLENLYKYFTLKGRRYFFFNFISYNMVYVHKAERSFIDVTTYVNPFYIYGA